MRAFLQERQGDGPDAPLFCLEGGSAMHLDTLRGRLKRWLSLIGVKDVSEYGFHSLRAGGATDAAKAGVEERHIKQHGNWPWASDAVRQYIRPDTQKRLVASSAIGADMRLSKVRLP